MPRSITTLVVLLVLVLFTGCKNPVAPEATATLSITGSATHVDVAFGTGSAAPVYHGSTLPFTRTLYGLNARDFVYLIAGIDTSPDSGSITVTITKDGKTLYEATASGFPNTATAAGPF